MQYAPRAFSMATPVRDLAARFFLRVSMLLARQYRSYSPLKQIGTIHVAGFGFARFLRDRFGIPRPLEREFLLFLSLFDGAADVYLSDFGTMVPDEIDSIWGKCVGYPGAREGEPFNNWVNGHQFTQNDTELTYNYFGYPRDPGAFGQPRLAMVPLVLNAVDLRRRLRRLRAFLKTHHDSEQVSAAVQELIAELPIGIELAAR